MPLTLAHFAYADICMGVHGAGLANCAFVNPNALMFEFQNWHNYGFDSFAKVSNIYVSRNVANI
jgi:capsular polysaccharide biosynthesis protein